MKLSDIQNNPALADTIWKAINDAAIARGNYHLEGELEAARALYSYASLPYWTGEAANGWPSKDREDTIKRHSDSIRDNTPYLELWLLNPTVALPF